MGWVIGIDEAGYGPNLGPLVMTSVACRTPDDLSTKNLWDILQSAVRKHGGPEDGRLVVDDSKRVYASGQGLAALEANVLAGLTACELNGAAALGGCLECLAPTALSDLRGEAWYTGTSAIPGEASAVDIDTRARGLIDASRAAGVVWGPVRSVVLCAPRFNALLDRGESKGIVLAHGLTELLRWNRAKLNGEPSAYYVDKHGGRNHYAALLQDALEEGMVLAVQEGALRSHYRLFGIEPEVTVTVQPRADADHFCVALASMVSKYLRERLMAEFNCFWQQHVPNLIPTAGYPSDAVRFLDAIRPALATLGIAESAVWRRK